MNAVSLASRFKEVVLNGTFIANTNYFKELSALDWQMAIAKVGSLNTIALLTQHILYYLEGVNRALAGGALDIKDQYSFDFAPISSEDDWQKICNRFWQAAELFSQQVAALSNEQLLQPFVEEKYGSYQRNIDAMIEHCYYHLGQIVIIKKMLLSR